MKRILALLVLLAAIVAALIGWRWLTAIPQARGFAPPAVTAWRPQGPRVAGARVDPVLPQPDAFHTMHANSANSDEIWSAMAPMFEFDWLAEPEMYVAEGPTFDNHGNLYFSPVNPKEDLSLVALDRLTGKRRWTIPGRGAGSGAPLILNDPSSAGQQMIFHATYTTAMALRPDGSRLWEVPTGLQPSTRRPGERDLSHVWGMNYQPQSDAVFGVTMDGWVFAHDRRSGKPLLRVPFRLPGAPAAVTARPPEWICKRADAETDAAFGRNADGMGMFTAIYDVIFGNGVNVANFYAIDPNTGDLYIAATAADEQDGAADGVSRNGALYRLVLQGNGPEDYALHIADTFTFDGSTGSTPTVSADGASVAVSDDNGNVITLDHRLHERWRINVGAQVAASIAVSADNNEMYAVTRYDIIKLIDHGTSASIAWRARLDAYPGFDNFNALTPTITANGILVSVSGGRRVGKEQLMSKFGMGLLDRETGTLRWFSEGREESIAVSSAGPDGAAYTAGSPVRRAIARAVFGDRIPPLAGGISRYRPIRPDLLARDCLCAAAGYANRLVATPEQPTASQRDDQAQIKLLLEQTRTAVTQASERQELTPEKAAQIRADVVHVSSSLDSGDAATASSRLKTACGRFN